MSWYDQNYRYRIPIAMDNTAGGGGAADLSMSIPTDLDLFWDVVQSDGDDIRITGADGRTLATYDIESFSVANRTAIIEIDNYTCIAATMQQLWLYWSYSSASNAESAVTTSSPLSGYICQEVPTGYVVVVQPERQGSTSPRNRFQKGANEQITLWFDFRGMLHRRAKPSKGSLLLEEIDYVSLVQVEVGAAAQAAMVDATKTRFVDGFVGMVVKAGTSGTNYTAICRVVTTGGSVARTLEGRAYFTVRNVTEQ